VQIFAYTDVVFNVPQTRLCDFVVRCKACDENMPASVIVGMEKP